MKIMRTDFKTGTSTKVSSHQNVTTSTAHAFMVRAAKKEADKLGGSLRIIGGELSGTSMAIVVVNGKNVATYDQDWPARQNK